jgi:hypothetical protein
MRGLAAATRSASAALAAFEEFTANKCVGFDGVAITQADSTACSPPRPRRATARPRARPRAGALAAAPHPGAATRCAHGRTIDTLKDIAAHPRSEAIRVAGARDVEYLERHDAAVGPNSSRSSSAPS